MTQNPWEPINEQFKIGQNIKGTISNITDFGFFVELLPGIDGLVHVSDLSWTEHIEHPLILFKSGDIVEAVILAIDEQNKRISLGIKQLTQDPWESIEQEYPVDASLKAKFLKLLILAHLLNCLPALKDLFTFQNFRIKRLIRLKMFLKLVNAKNSALSM